MNILFIFKAPENYWDKPLGTFVLITILFLILYGINGVFKNKPFKKILRLKSYLFIVTAIWLGPLIALAVTYKKDDNIDKWTEKQKQQMYDSLYKSLLSLDVTDLQKKQIANCIVSKTVSYYPNGYKSVPKDSVDIVISGISKRCAEEIVK